MQRFACLFLLISAACGGGTATGMATLTGVDGVKASAIEPFEGADAAANQVLGWNILFYEQAAGGDCLEGTVLAKISIFTNQAKGSAPQAILPSNSSVSIVPESPPTVLNTAVANMGAEGVGTISGIVNITEFHLTPDAKHADRMTGSVNAGGYAGETGVSLTGNFTAPICVEE